MQINLLITLLLVPYINAGRDQNGRKINLEDIERDNILSEHQAKTKEVLEKQQTQNIRPPGIHTQYKSFTGPSLSPSRGGVIYAPSSSHQEDEDEPQFQQRHQDDDYTHNNEGSKLHYVTPSLNAIHEPHHTAQVYSAPAVHESPRTYAVPSRQTLLKPIIPTLASRGQQQAQPHYVYLQARRQQQQQQEVQETSNLKHVANDNQYAGHQEQYSEVAATYRSAGEDGQSPLEHKQQQQQQNEAESYEQEQPGSMNYLQYVPYIAPGSSEGHTYIMMAPIPAGYQPATRQISRNPSVVTYSHSDGAAVVPAADIGYHQHHQQSIVGGVQYAQQTYFGNNDIPTGPGVSVNTQDQDIEYANPNQIESVSLDKSKQYLYAPKHPEYQSQQPTRYTQLPRLEFNSNHRVIPLQQPAYSTPTVVQALHVPTVQAEQLLNPVQQFQQQQQFQSSYSAPNVDFFHGREAKSLLDSYIPSWVILQRQRSLLQNFATPVTNGYNTISYSIPHSPRHGNSYQNKRSTKLRTKQ